MLLATVALAVVVVALAFHLWDRYVEDQLGRWAVGELAQRTDGTYRLVLGDLSFRPLAGSLSFDSAIVATDTVRNRRRETPLPALALRAQGCRVSGVDLLGLAFRRSFDARGLGCDRVVARIALPSRPQRERRSAPDSAAPAARLEKLARPLGLSSFRIAEVALPALSFTLMRPGARGGASILVEHARFEAKELVFDLREKPRERRRLSADAARLRATGLILRPDTLTEIAIAGVEASLTDSTLRLAGAKYEPPIPEAEWVRRVRVRRDRIRFEVDSVRARGVAYRAFVATGDIGLRALELEGARLDVLSDRRIPRGPPKRHRTPQQVAARPGQALRLDSVIIDRGTMVYRERKPEREQPGWVSFGGVRATIVHLHLPPRDKPLTIVASARLMNQGLLTLKASVPLDAPDLRFELSGKLGRMPAKALNRFLTENESFELDDGLIEGITFRQTARNGRVTTILTPRYHDLSVEPSGDGGGPINAVKEFVADAFVVRSRNPDKDGDNLRTTRIARRYDPTQGWLQFLWFSLRDALKEALKE